MTEKHESKIVWLEGERLEELLKAFEDSQKAQRYKESE